MNRCIVCECGAPNPRRSIYGCDECKARTYAWHRREHEERVMELGRPEGYEATLRAKRQKYNPTSWVRHQGPAAMRRAGASS